MGKRKIFSRTELSIPEDEHILAIERKTTKPPESFPPQNTIVNFKHNATGLRSFDFAPWYGIKIDTITYACQRQIERFLAGQDNIISISTISEYCNTGLRSFLDYCSIRAKAIRRKLTPSDINRNLIDGYLHHLKNYLLLPHPKNHTTVKQLQYSEHLERVSYSPSSAPATTLLFRKTHSRTTLESIRVKLHYQSESEKISQKHYKKP